MTNRVAGLPDEILLAIVAQIQARVPALSNAGNCFIALDPEKMPGAATGGFFCVVTPRGGEFVSGYIVGGGQLQCTLRAKFTTRLYSTTQTDPARQDTAFLTDAERGIFPLATQVLQALALFDPVINGALVLRDQIEPTHLDTGRGSRNLGWLELGFTLHFDWDLS